MSRKDLNRDQRDQLAKLADLPDDQIDILDIPEAPAENWAHARRGDLYRPLKLPVTIRLDADVLAWFREHVEEGGGYQTEINRVLRRYVAEQLRHRS
ncbi:BrnA antitoxin family protein [Mesorhizobium sp. WSM3224]|uniref:BrnA antitoxin family protein n=1 Tax=Mesorhizobium sp. WSM3224 TaxID=1040986 RepID=UPI00040827FD